MVGKHWKSFPIYGIVGVVVILGAELCLALKIKIVSIYFTPLVWTGYIILLDSLLWLRRGRSLIRSRTREFLWMLPWSVCCWLIFEGFNFYLKNWQYVGLPSNIFAEAMGYVWSFATILPAILLTADYIDLKLPIIQIRSSFQPSRPLLYNFVAVGAGMVILPLLLPQDIAAKQFWLVWIGFIFLLDPVNYIRQQDSIIRQLSQGKLTKLISLVLSGLCCGVLWEFWNYWADAKWMYNVPISFAGPKIFEMPLLGYLGFLPFAVECFVMNEFFFSLFPHLRQAPSQ